ncbi:hypothetical protein RIF29_24331 [Crotalaria pallida]|uniref:PB1-like domain-containing protein n=1 Tax=Crotalaria pallida TaxID=3830 RepID=A0AAN9I354_CROPI
MQRENELGGMDNYFRVHVHHGGHFVSGNRSLYLGHVSLWNCDPDRWSFFEIFDIAREMNYEQVDTIWYKDLDNNIQQIVDDEGAEEVANIAMAKGSSHLYLLHPVSQPILVGELPASGPQQNDSGVFETEENGRPIIDLTCNGPGEDTGPQEHQEETGVHINETENVAQGNEANIVGQGNEATIMGQGSEANTVGQSVGPNKKRKTKKTAKIANKAKKAKEQEEGQEEEQEKNDDSAMKVRFDDSDDEDIEKDFFETATSKVSNHDAATNLEPSQLDGAINPDAAITVENANIPEANPSPSVAAAAPLPNANQANASTNPEATPTQSAAAATPTEGETTTGKKRGRPPKRAASIEDDLPFNIEDENDCLEFDTDSKQTEEEAEPELDRFSEPDYNSDELESEEDTDEERDIIVRRTKRN